MWQTWLLGNISIVKHVNADCLEAPPQVPNDYSHYHCHTLIYKSYMYIYIHHDSYAHIITLNHCVCNIHSIYLSMYQQCTHKYLLLVSSIFLFPCMFHAEIVVIPSRCTLLAPTGLTAVRGNNVTLAEKQQEMMMLPLLTQSMSIIKHLVVVGVVRKKQMIHFLPFCYSSALLYQHYSFWPLRYQTNCEFAIHFTITGRKRSSSQWNLFQSLMFSTRMDKCISCKVHDKQYVNRLHCLVLIYKVYQSSINYSVRIVIGITIGNME